MTSADRAAAYLATLPPAIAGSGGHAATYRAACVPVEFGVAEAEAIEILKSWNLTHCQPPWTEAELQHKLSDAYRHTAPKPEFTAAVSARNGVTSWRQSSPSPMVKRPALPALRPGTGQDFAALASLRNLSVEGVRLASDRGLLRFGEYRGHAAWFILDGSGRIAQARRLNGSPWADGVKAWTLAGSQGTWPVGVAEAAPFPVVAFCEGGPDLLAAHHFIFAEGRQRDCAAVAILGGANIHAEALPLFAGKRVRIFGHADASGTGARAVERWAGPLANAGAEVDAFNFARLRQVDGKPVKDLNDCARVHAEDFEAHACLSALMP